MNMLTIEPHGCKAIKLSPTATPSIEFAFIALSPPIHIIPHISLLIFDVQLPPKKSDLKGLLDRRASPDSHCKQIALATASGSLCQANTMIHVWNIYQHLPPKKIALVLCMYIHMYIYIYTYNQYAYILYGWYFRAWNMWISLSVSYNLFFNHAIASNKSKRHSRPAWVTHDCHDSNVVTWAMTHKKTHKKYRFTFIIHYDPLDVLKRKVQDFNIVYI